jgi:hypothetical protein
MTICSYSLMIDADVALAVAAVAAAAAAAAAAATIACASSLTVGRSCGRSSGSIACILVYTAHIMLMDTHLFIST